MQSKRFQTEEVVLTFDHTEQSIECQDQQLKGDEWGQRCYHIKTPLTLGCSTMYRFTLSGYSYGIGQPLDLIWCGYLFSGYTDTQKLWQVNCTDLHNNCNEVTQYIGTDNHLYLSFGPISRYCNGFQLKYMAHYSNTQLGLNKNEYRVIVTSTKGML